MKLTLKHDPHLNIVVAKPEGDVNQKNVTQTIIKTLELSSEKGCSRLLFDITECPIGQSLGEAFDGLINLQKTTGLSSSYRTAIIYNPIKFPVERAKFVEDVIANRGNLFFKTFNEEEEAISWLTAT